jgi:hypothetical protein
MKTTQDRKDFTTHISGADREILDRIVGLLAPLVKLDQIGSYSSMSADELWWHLVVQVCVMSVTF